MTGLSAKRWQRFGHNRVYFSTAEGVAVGWVDLDTGDWTIQSASHEAEFSAAMDEWARHYPVLRTTPRPPGPPPVASIADLVPAPRPHQGFSGPLSADPMARVDPLAAAVDGWHDLAVNRPGALARARARELRAEAPLRTLVERALGMKTEERGWRVGADGEALVGARLQRLAKHGWHVLHAVQVGDHGSDIDHVVVGPGGVFTINAKHHPGARVSVKGNAVRVNGTYYPYVPKSVHEAKRAALALSAAHGRPVAVTGLIVLVNAEAFTVMQPPTSVGVTTRSNVASWLRERPHVLAAEQVEAIFEVARRSTTWVS